MQGGCGAGVLRGTQLFGAWQPEGPTSSLPAAPAFPFPAACRRSDLASIFVQLFDDDALAFACFERLMRSARRNFKHDETGIRWAGAGAGVPGCTRAGANGCRPPAASPRSPRAPRRATHGCRHQLRQIARVLRDTDPSLYAKLQRLGAEDCMFAYRRVCVGGGGCRLLYCSSVL